MPRADVLREAARQRVESTPELRPYLFILVDACPNDQPSEHWQWLVSGTVKNIVQCAEYMVEPS